METKQSAKFVEELGRASAEKSAALESKLAEMSSELERRNVRVAELEKSNRDLRVENAKLQGEILHLKAQECGQGATYRAVVRKLMQTADFGKWCMSFADGAIALGQNWVLRRLMEVCPTLRLRKSELGWDPHSENRANVLQQKAQKELPDFTLLKELDKKEKAWTVEEVEQLEVDHDVDLDKVYDPLPEEWVCEDDNVPYIVDTASAEPLVDKRVS